MLSVCFLSSCAYGATQRQRPVTSIALPPGGSSCNTVTATNTVTVANIITVTNTSTPTSTVQSGHSQETIPFKTFMATIFSLIAILIIAVIVIIRLIIRNRGGRLRIDSPAGGYPPGGNQHVRTEAGLLGEPLCGMNELGERSAGELPPRGASELPARGENRLPGVGRVMHDTDERRAYHDGQTSNLDSTPGGPWRRLQIERHSNYHNPSW